VLPKLRKLGFHIPQDIRYGYPNNSELNEITEVDSKRKSDFANLVETLSRAGFTVDEKFVEEQTGVKMKGR